MVYNPHTDTDQESLHSFPFGITSQNLICPKAQEADDSYQRKDTNKPQLWWPPRCSSTPPAPDSGPRHQHCADDLLLPSVLPRPFRGLCPQESPSLILEASTDL